MSFIFNLNDPVVRGYLFCSSLLIGKVLFMVPCIGYYRFKKKIFISPEDTVLTKNAKVVNDDPDIERVRRAHLNDLENIPMFIFAGAIYLLTNPNPTVAVTLYQSYVAFRFIHTFVYAIYVVPQPARAIAWGISYFINWYMVITSAITFCGF